MLISRTQLTRTAWSKVVRGGVSIPVLTITMIAALMQPALPASSPSGGGRAAGTPAARAAVRARGESQAFVARSRLTTADLIRAAAQAGARVPGWRGLLRGRPAQRSSRAPQP